MEFIRNISEVAMWGLGLYVMAPLWIYMMVYMAVRAGTNGYYDAIETKQKTEYNGKEKK